MRAAIAHRIFAEKRFVDSYLQCLAQMRMRLSRTAIAPCRNPGKLIGSAVTIFMSSPGYREAIFPFRLGRADGAYSGAHVKPYRHGVSVSGYCYSDFRSTALIGLHRRRRRNRHIRQVYTDLFYGRDHHAVFRRDAGVKRQDVLSVRAYE